MTADTNHRGRSRRLATGYKGEAWTANVSCGGSEAAMLLDTGLDSVSIRRIPNGAWDRAPIPSLVRSHRRHDEAIVIPTGSGTLFHGPDPDHIGTSRFDAPVVLALPAGAWHHVTMDPAVDALGFAFFTATDTVINPFAAQMAAIKRGRVELAKIPVAAPSPLPSGDAGNGSVADRKIRAQFPVPEEGRSHDARIIPYEYPGNGYVTPLDTGRDSLFVMVSRGGSWDRSPEFVDVHLHPDVDEYIVRERGEGYVLNGPSPKAVTRIPFHGQTVLVMPAGGFHRVVQTDDSVSDSILVYADRRAIVGRYDEITERQSAIHLTGVVRGGASQ